jgi:AcrR family transcriptional regulator
MTLHNHRTDPPLSRLERSQEARRVRILDATYALAREGGYDAVQLRAVSHRSHVALATIYRYFTSRDHLIAAAITRRPLPSPIVPPHGGGSLHTRAWLKSAYRWLVEPFEEEPNLLEAWVRASASRTPQVSALVAARWDGFWGQIARILPADNPAFADDVAMILSHVWYSSITQWVHGVLAVKDIYNQIERTIDRLIPPTPGCLQPVGERPAAAGPRRSPRHRHIVDQVER